MDGTSPEFAIPLLLEKVATSLALPLGTVLILGVAALLALVRKRHRLGGALLAVAVLWLWMCSTPVASFFLAPLIGQFPPQRVEELPSVDAIVVLGGAVMPAADSRPFTHIHTTADRAWHAARLFHAGKAPIIVASGGTVWPVSDPTSAAACMRELLEGLGVPTEAIVLEEESRNTRQNATHTVRVATERGIGDVLLVTSPWHMPRAVATFRAAGLPVVPAPSALARGPFGGGLQAFVPSATALATNTKAMRELLAQIVYRWRGWA